MRGVLIDKILNNILIKINASLRLNDFETKQIKKKNLNQLNSKRRIFFFLTNYQFNTNYC